jgi:O-antigen ligase
MAGWDKVTRGKWMTLAVGVAGLYIFLSLASNRGPVIILIEKLTFNPSTAWWRVYIWEYGVQNVMAHPFVGLGLNDWARPTWLAPTVDNFWLLTAMQAGIPAVTFLVLGIVINVFYILRAKNLSAQARDARTGYLVVLAGSAFTISTVHVWDAMAVFMMFYFGAGSFLFSAPPESEVGLPETSAQRHSASGGTRPAIVYARAGLVRTGTRAPEETTVRKTPLPYARRPKGTSEPESRLTRPGPKDKA